MSIVMARLWLFCVSRARVLDKTNWGIAAPEFNEHVWTLAAGTNFARGIYLVVSTFSVQTYTMYARNYEHVKKRMGRNSKTLAKSSKGWNFAHFMLLAVSFSGVVELRSV